MKILVISGFLGAGKTTFIRELAKRTKRDFAVMENEYGAVNVDGELAGEVRRWFVEYLGADRGVSVVPCRRILPHPF